MNQKYLPASLLVSLFASLASAPAQTTAFTYQGLLLESGMPANGTYEMTFTLHDAVAGGNAMAGPVTNLAVRATNGHFTLLIDFGGGVFAGNDRWLEIGVRPGGSGGNFTPLNPRQPITPAPLSLYAQAAGTVASMPAVNLTGTVADGRLSTNVAMLSRNQSFTGTNRFNGVVIATNAGNQIAGTFAGSGAGLTNLNGGALANGSVSNAALAVGAVQTTNLASASVTAAKLDLGFQSGTLTDGIYRAHDTGSVVFIAAYDRPFVKTPSVTLIPSDWSLASSGLTGFTATAQFFLRGVDSADNVGQYCSLASVNGKPAISYYDATSGRLMYVRATDARGTAWSSPQVLDSGGVGQYTSLAVVSGRPAISYYDVTGGNLKYVRAADADGTVWGLPVTIDSLNTVGAYTSLAVVNRQPAISYYDVSGGNLKYVRATDTQGAAWGAPITIDSNNTVGTYTSLAVINRQPAISYYDVSGGNLKYVRATDADGTAWGAPVTVDSTNVVGQHTSLAVVNGSPAISYFYVTGGDLRYVRATDTDGAVWGDPVTVDATNTVGAYSSLAVVGGYPAISYYSTTGGDLKFVRANDATGSSWDTPLTLDGTNSVGFYTSLAVINGSPAISYYDATDDALKYATLPGLDWQAGDGTVAPLIAAGALRTVAVAADAAGDGLGGGDDRALVVNVDGQTLEISEDALRVKSGSITTNEVNLAGFDSRYVNAAGDTVNGDLIVSGQLTIGGGNPGEGRLLVSDAGGRAVWRTLDQVLLATNYQYTPPIIATNMAEIVVTGVMTNTQVEMVNGPGLTINRIAGNPDSSGNNREFDVVFDYSGPRETALTNWFIAGTNAPVAIIVRDTTGLERYRWNLANFKLGSIVNSGGGKRRYTLSHLPVADLLADIDRVPGNWGTTSDRSIAGDTKVEIVGILTGSYPLVSYNTTDKTITMTFAYHEGGWIWDWVEQIAESGTSGVGHKDISLIYERYGGGPANEIGRNNFYGCFPIRYQQIAGFDLDTAGLEQVVIAYEFAQNAASGPLYVPPVVAYDPGTGGMMVARDMTNNRVLMEIEGVVTTHGWPLAEQPVIIQGPGLVIDRVPGFDGLGNPDDESGLNRELPLIFDVPGSRSADFYNWRTAYYNLLPDIMEGKSMSLIVTDGTFDSTKERLRFNLYEMIPFEVAPASNNYTRVTLYVSRPADMRDFARDDGGPWGNTAVNNPATDTPVLITGLLTNFFPEVTVNTTNRTLTFDFAYGEGQAIKSWVTDIAETGTLTAGKRTITLNPSGTPQTFQGCFPIFWQYYSGFERYSKGRQRVVISYDTKSP